jgi:hypothetical protein
MTPKLSDSFKTVIARPVDIIINGARSGATWQSLSLKTRFLTEFTLRQKTRFLALLGMTNEGFGMTILKASSI